LQGVELSAKVFTGFTEPESAFRNHAAPFTEVALSFHSVELSVQESFPDPRISGHISIEVVHVFRFGMRNFFSFGVPMPLIAKMTLYSQAT
jgi:hypothetical protein